MVLVVLKVILICLFEVQSDDSLRASVLMSLYFFTFI